MSDENDPDEWRRLVGAWLDRLRKEGAVGPPQQQLPETSLIVKYRTLADGEPFHTQDMGWRMTADILYREIIERQVARPGRTADESQLHVEFDALATRQVCYVFLACWRLSIEIELKRALVASYEALAESIPNKVGQLLRGHDIAGLWQRFVCIVPALERALQKVASDNDIDPSGIGFVLDFGGQQDAVNLIVEIDPDGQSLRYRENLKGERNMSNLTEINIAAAHVMCTNLHLFLQGCSGRASTLQQLRECREIMERVNSDGSP